MMIGIWCTEVLGGDKIESPKHPFWKVIILLYEVE